MALPISPPYAPMEALLVDEIPVGKDWQYEPKWDGFRYASKEKVIGSLLLGLYDDQGLLNHVGYTSGFVQREREALLKKVEPLIKAPGFTGNAPAGPSRWSTKRSAEWQPLAPRLVVEV